jgi:transcriptional regulator with XRE-family HTH domain
MRCVIQLKASGYKTMVYLGSSVMKSRKRIDRPAPGLSPEQIEIEAHLRQNLPKVIQREREARGITQEQLAERSGIHSTTVGKIERGAQIPSIALLTILAKALDVSVLELLRAALPETVAMADSVKEDETVSHVRSLPKPERRRLLQLLGALEEWKGGGPS